MLKLRLLRELFPGPYFTRALSFARSHHFINLVNVATCRAKFLVMFTRVHCLESRKEAQFLTLCLSARLRGSRPFPSLAFRQVMSKLTKSLNTPTWPDKVASCTGHLRLSM